MRGMLNLFLSIAAGAAIGIIIPHLPFLRDPPYVAQYQQIENDLHGQRPGEQEENDAESSGGESTLVSSQPSQFETYSDQSDETDSSAPSERAEHPTESVPLSVVSSEQRQVSSPSRHVPQFHTPLPVVREVSVIRDVDVLALLDITAPCSIVKDPHDDKCTVCIDPIMLGQEARTTPCNHLFHASCLEKWVLYITASLMNVAAYWLAQDGSIQYKSRFPFCPNCLKFLDVVPRHEWRVVLLTALAVTLSVDSTNQAMALYERDVVVKDRSSPPVVIHIRADEYGFRPRWMDENEHYHYTFVARNEGYRVLLRVLAYPIVSNNNIVSNNDSAIEQEG